MTHIRGRRRPVMVFQENNADVHIYPSILEASRATGISETKIRYALVSSRTGAIKGTKPRIYVDTLLEPSDVYDDN